MMTAIPPGQVAVSAVAVLASSAFLGVMLRYRSNPTTRPLIGAAVTLVLGAVLHLLVVLEPVRTARSIPLASTDAIGGLWLLVAFDLSAVFAGFWFLFALQYTGQSDRTSSIAVAVVAMLFAFLVVPSFALGFFGSVVGFPAPTLNALLGLLVILAEALAMIGVFLVLAATLRHKAFPIGQTGLLTLAVAAVFTLPFTATTLRVPVATPTAIIIASALLSATILRYRLFETLPVATFVGRDRIINELSEGVVVLDTDHRVHDVNPEAERLLAVDKADVTGTPIQESIPSLPVPDQLATSGPRDVHLDSGLVASVSADTVTDTRGRQLGRLLVCRDVTDERRHEHRLAVLTQLVAGATQQQLSSVADAATAIIEADRNSSAVGAGIRETTTDVATLVARVRDVEHALAEKESRNSAPFDVARVVSDLSTSLNVTLPAADTALRVDADRALFTATMEALATGTTSTSDATLTVRRTDDHAAVKIEPFDAGTDQSIAGLSLQIAQLAADSAKWEIGATDAGAVSVQIPRSDDAHQPDAGGESA